MGKQHRLGNIQMALQGIGVKPGWVPAQSIMRGIQGEEKFSRGGRLDAGEQIDTQRVMAGMSASGQTPQQIVAIIHMLADAHIDLKTKFETVAKAMNMKFSQMMIPPGS